MLAAANFGRFANGRFDGLLSARKDRMFDEDLGPALSRAGNSTNRRGHVEARH
ncbi:MAG: hypothetical protein ACRD2X_05050 [Vicinamibacteraceae bacterium]